MRFLESRLGILTAAIDSSRRLALTPGGGFADRRLAPQAAGARGGRHLKPRANTIVLGALAIPATVLFAMTLGAEWDRVGTAFELLPRSWAEQHLAYEAKVPDHFFAFAEDCARFVPADAWVLLVTPPDLGEALYFRLAYLLYPRAVVPLDLGHFAFRNLSPYGRMRPEDVSRVSYVVFFRAEPRGSMLAESDLVFANAEGAYAIRRMRAKADAAP